MAKPADDHLPDPEGSNLPSSAIASANSEVRSVIDSDHHPPFSNTCIYVGVAECESGRILVVYNISYMLVNKVWRNITIRQICQTLVPLNFCCLRYMCVCVYIYVYVYMALIYCLSGLFTRIHAHC